MERARDARTSSGWTRLSDQPGTRGRGVATSTLHSLLADSRRFSASYANGMANHLAMALVALDRLGASDDPLREFPAFYQRQLPAKPGPAATLPAKFGSGR